MFLKANVLYLVVHYYLRITLFKTLRKYFTFWKMNTQFSVTKI